MAKNNDLLFFNDNFIKYKDNATYEPRGAAFLMVNTGNTVIILNDMFPIQPCGTYGLLNAMPNAVSDGTYRIKFGKENVVKEGEPIKNEMVIAEVHFSHRPQSEYAR